jgi:serine/threonine protein kinase
MAKRILRQALRGLEFLHQNGIAHGDIQPGNLLFTLSNLEVTMCQDEYYKWGPTDSPVQRKDGKTDKWAPRYLAVPQPLDEFADISSELRIKLADLGG